MLRAVAQNGYENLSDGQKLSRTTLKKCIRATAPLPALRNVAEPGDCYEGNIPPWILIIFKIDESSVHYHIMFSRYIYNSIARASRRQLTAMTRKKHSITSFRIPNKIFIRRRLEDVTALSDMKPVHGGEGGEILIGDHDGRFPGRFQCVC